MSLLPDQFRPERAGARGPGDRRHVSTRRRVTAIGYGPDPLRVLLFLALWPVGLLLAHSGLLACLVRGQRPASILQGRYGVAIHLALGAGFLAYALYRVQPGLMAGQGGQRSGMHAGNSRSAGAPISLPFTIYGMRIIERLGEAGQPLVRGLPAGLTAAHVRCGACHSSWPHRAA